MHRTVVAAAVLLLAACGLDPSEDERPRTLDYITSAILKPSCGVAQCHSSFRNQEKRSYGTVEETCKTIFANDGDVVPTDSSASKMYTVLTRLIDRMPYDQPLPEVDQALIKNWIDRGAPGLPARAEDCP